MMNLYYITSNNLYTHKDLKDIAEHFNSHDYCVFGETLYIKSLFQKLFYTQKENAIYFTDSIINFKKIDGFQFILDEEKVFFYRNTGLVMAPYTLYSNIYRVPVYSEISLERNRLVFKPIYPSGGDEKLEQEQFENRIKKIIKDCPAERKILLHGGGADSTFLMGLCRELKMDMNVLTCVMTGMESEAILATRISEKLGYNNEKHTCVPERLRIILDEYINKNMEVVSDPAMPILTEMLYEKKVDGIIDGQGADSLLLSLPFCKLFRLYHKKIAWLYQPLSCILSVVNPSKDSSFGRKLYCVKKVVNALSQPTIEDCLLSSLGYPESSCKLEYYKEVKKQLQEIFSFYKDKYKTLSYVFMFRILPVRELQKYENLKAINIQTCLPFLDSELIKYIFQCKVEDLLDGKNVKKPIFLYIEEKIPNYIKKNKTHPFFVKYTSKDMGFIENTYKGKKYPISDLSNYAFTSYNIIKLKEVIDGLGV